MRRRTKPRKRALPVIPVVPSPSLVSLPRTVIVAALSPELVPASPVVLVIAVTHGAVKGGLGPGQGCSGCWTTTRRGKARPSGAAHPPLPAKAAVRGPRHPVFFPGGWAAPTLHSPAHPPRPAIGSGPVPPSRLSPGAQAPPIPHLGGSRPLVSHSDVLVLWETWARPLPRARGEDREEGEREIRALSSGAAETR